ncbi:MAG: hypothetical protein U9N57_14135 [Pseudomonadota bacterium]|nr:hypothetical protein [Pseudomonadota bacterium]
MALKFFGQKIFDANLKCVGVELLVREIPYGLDIVRSPMEIMEHPEFCSKDMYAIDMQLMTYLHLHESEIKKSQIKYVFINVSDNLLSRLILGDDTSFLFRLLSSLVEALSPVKVVIEVNELSRIRKEHLEIIVERLKSIGLKIAQDDYTSHREEYLSIDWDFIKLDLETCKLCEVPKSKQLVIEKSDNNVLGNLNGSEFHQGFYFHEPEDLSVLFSGESICSLALVPKAVNQ